MKKTIALVAALLVAPAAYADDPAKTTETTTSQPAPTAKAKPAKLEAADLQVIAHYHELNQKEIKLGKYVARVSKTAAVKDYAQMLVKDHGDADKKLMAMAKTRRAIVPKEKARNDEEKQEMAAAKKDAAKLMTLKGADLDAQYIAAMIAGHEKELGKVDAMASEAKDAEVADMARGKRETLQKHADHARMVQKDLQPGQASVPVAPVPPVSATAHR